MQKTDWSEVRSKLKKAIDQGVKILKEGGQGARNVAFKTAHVLQAEIEIQRLKAKIAFLAERFGHAVNETFEESSFKMDSPIKEMHDELTLLKKQLKKKESELKHVSITEKPTPAPKRKKTRKTSSPT